MPRLQGKVAVITGGGRGLATAQRLRIFSDDDSIILISSIAAFKGIDNKEARYDDQR
jgi:hypothetical protein